MAADKKLKQLNLLGGFLLVAGSIAVAFSLVSLLSGSGQLAQAKAQIDRQLSLVEARIQQKGVLTRQIEEIQQELDKRFVELDQLLKSPGIRFGYGVQALLGLGTAFTGIGFLKRRVWVIKWVAIQSVVAIIFYFWWWLASPLVTYRHSLSELMFNLLSRAVPWTTQVQIQNSVKLTEQISQWGGLLFVVLWNGCLFWFVRQPSVKKACQAA